jgi:RNA polymerase sigma-70 factor (ECF subfamily)
MAESVDQLLARVALGDQAAFRALYAASAGRLLGVAMRLIGDKARAEDALQESFVAIWNQAGKYAAHRAQAMTWMTAIVRNKAIDSLRATPKEMPLTQTNDDGEESSHDVADHNPGPLQSLLERCADERLRHCLGHIEESPRQALLMAFYDGLTHQELAERLATP